jgi:hypothetical protein
MHRTYLAALRTTKLSGALILFFLSGVAMANDDDLTKLKERLHELRTATDIVLMIVPYPTLFRVRVDEVRLPSVSCVYEITSGRGSAFDQVLNIISSAVMEYNDGPKPGADLRVGIVFREDGKVVQEFYFDDWGGHHKVNGFSRDRRILASANLPNRLRELLTRQEVVLIKNGNNPCPHS